jgi:hypothetical protein
MRDFDWSCLRVDLFGLRSDATDTAHTS